MRIVFMGTPSFAVPALDTLVMAGHDIAAAYTQPPRPAGRRGRALVPSPVQARAETLGIPVRTPTTLRTDEAQADFAVLAADVAVVAAYGLILPPPILTAPRHGCLNIHGSLLPRWRGAAPVQRAILAGDVETGVGIMQMAAGLDTGPVRREGRLAIDGRTAGELTDALARLGADLMVKVLADLPAYPPIEQPTDGVTYATKIDKAEAELDFTQTADAVERQIRAFNPPGAWFTHAGERIRILAAEPTQAPPPPPPGEGRGPVPPSDLDPGLRRGADSRSVRAYPPTSVRAELVEALPLLQNQDSPSTSSGRTGLVLDAHLTIACADGTAIRPTRVQRAGRGAMTVGDLLRGFAIPPGTRL